MQILEEARVAEALRDGRRARKLDPDTEEKIDELLKILDPDGDKPGDENERPKEFDKFKRYDTMSSIVGIDLEYDEMEQKERDPNTRAGARDYKQRQSGKLVLEESDINLLKKSSRAMAGSDVDPEIDLEDVDEAEAKQKAEETLRTVRQLTRTDTAQFIAEQVEDVVNDPEFDNRVFTQDEIDKWVKNLNTFVCFFRVCCLVMCWCYQTQA